jgi:2-aminoadipate transaminase
MTTTWEDLYASRVAGMQSSAIRELLKLTQKPEIISFAGGMPAPELFPRERFKEATSRVLDDQGEIALQYSTTEGWPELRQMIARHVSRYGIEAEADDIQITTGSQQALDLVGKLMIDIGDEVVVGAPTYLGALQAFGAYQASFLNVPLDEDGMTIEPVEDLLQRRPSFMYVLPNFQNPAGVTLSLDRRVALVEMARANGVPIVEDDPYGQLRYEGEHLPTLYALDAELAGSDGGLGNVIYMSTFSKTLAPGLRLAWVIAPRPVLARLNQLKQGADLHTSTLVQIVACEVARGGFLDEHIQRLRAVYRERRDAMLGALDRFMPAEVSWSHPQGGLFLWAQLPAGMDSQSVLAEAVKEQVAFVPGTAFFTQPNDGIRFMRLNFSNAQPDQIQEGIRRLGECLARLRPPMSASVPSAAPPGD